MIPCPSCVRTWATDVTLTAHLIDVHGMEGAAAHARAQQALKDAQKVDRRVAKKGRGRAMAKNKDRAGECPECHCLRHNKECSQHFRRKSKQTTAEPAAGTKRTPITRRHPKPKPKPPKTYGAETDGLLSELDALRSTVAALEPLGPIERLRVLGCICKLLAIDPANLAT